MEKLFNPYEWLPNTEKQPHFNKLQKTKSCIRNENEIKTEVENIITKIENLQIDFTINYTNWLAIGFSFAAEFGEDGREYFHRVSMFHPEYDIYSCNLQFDKCVNRPKAESP